MPNKITTTSGGETYGHPFVGPVDHTAAIVVDVSGLGTDEVDSKGYLKPGVPLKKAGVLADATAGEFIYGVVLEATKVADDNVAATLAAADDIEVVVGVIGAINQDMVEDNLGRALNANELAAFVAAGCHIALI